MFRHTCGRMTSMRAAAGQARLSTSSTSALTTTVSFASVRSFTSSPTPTNGSRMISMSGTGNSTFLAPGGFVPIAFAPVCGVRLCSTAATTTGNGLRASSSAEGGAGGATADGGVAAAGTPDEELRRARGLQGESGSRAAAGISLAGTAPAVDRHTPGGGTPTPSPTAVRSNERPRSLDSVKDLSEEDRALIRKALAPDPSTAPAADQTADGTKRRLGGVGYGVADGDMAAVFTCSVCECRTVKKFTKHAYTKGIVLVQCPGCGNKHLLADNMGWFSDGNVNIEQILKQRGEEVKKLEGSIYLEGNV